MIKATGLNTFGNDLGGQEGNLDEADNAIIDANNIIESRRGMALFGTSLPTASDRSKQVFSYKGRILRHYYDNTNTENRLQFDSDGDGTFSTFSGIYNETQPGLRIKGTEANGNFYFTTDTGIKKISANTASDFSTSSGYITDAGGVKALNLEGVVDYSQSGFFSANSSVAYRIVWGITDNNGNVILGAPSSRLVLYNTAGISAVVTLTFPVPSEVTSTSYFYQIYRTQQASGINDPGEEFNLIVEEFVTSGQLPSATGEVVYTDIVLDSFRDSGAILYTNNVSGEGADQSNEKPPLSKDVTLFKGSTFFANTSTVHRKVINLLSVNDIVDGDTITIYNSSATGTYTFKGSTEITEIDLSPATGSIPTSLDGSYLLINSYEDQYKYAPWFKGATGTLAPTGGTSTGRIPIEVDITGDASIGDVAITLQTTLDALDDFSASVSGNIVTVDHLYNGFVTDATNGTVSPGFTYSITQGTGESNVSGHILLSSLDTVSLAVDETARSLVSVINNDETSPVNAFYLSGVDDVPGQILLESRSLTDDVFYITANGTNVGAEFSPELPASGTSVSSSNEEAPNRIYYSKYQKPEAVPLLNYQDVGPKDKAILRIVPLRDNLFILKEDGIYRLSGVQAPNFNISLFDNSAILLAPDSVAVLNNQIYAMTTIGVIVISDTGVQVISRPIEDKIIKLQSSSFLNFKTASFGVGYESDKSYLFWTVSTKADTVATQCFRYNTFTNSWTRWPIAKTCGIVNSFNDKLYLGTSDTNYIEQERKNFDRTDYSDREYNLTISNNAINPSNMKEVSISSTSNAAVGDVLSQIQYITRYKFNSLLTKLDKDPLINDTDFSSLLTMSPGDNLSASMLILVAKLNADSILPGTYTFSGSLDFATIQTEYNAMIAELNLNAFFSNYRTSTGTIIKEYVITGVNKQTNTVTLEAEPSLLQGNIIIYKHIPLKVTYSPQTFGDSESYKQISEGKVMFQNDGFKYIDVSYSSDLSPSFESAQLDGTGNGAFGLFEWGNQTWGGEGLQAPIRTYIPLEKQRCRYIRTRIEHKIARENPRIFGIDNNPRAYSKKAYT